MCVWGGIHMWAFFLFSDPSDDEWEEASSSDESEAGPDALCDGLSGLMSPLCLSAEVHAALINHNIPEKARLYTLYPSSNLIMHHGLGFAEIRTI